MSGFVKAGQTFLKNLMKGGKQKTTGTEVISSVPISKNVKKHGIPYSVAKTRLNESYKRSKQVDKNYKTMKEAKEAFKGAKKDLQNMVDTGRATKINKKVHRKGIEFKSDDLYPNLKKKIEKKKDGGRIGRKFGGGANMGKKKTNVQKIKETFGPKKQLSAKQMKIAKLAGDPKKIDAKDLAKLRGRG